MNDPSIPSPGLGEVVVGVITVSGGDSANGELSLKGDVVHIGDLERDTVGDGISIGPGNLQRGVLDSVLGLGGGSESDVSEGLGG